MPIEVPPHVHFVGTDMAGDALYEEDWVYDGEQAWRVAGRSEDGLLELTNPDLNPPPVVRRSPRQVNKILPYRRHDVPYMESVRAQTMIMAEFWEEDDEALWRKQ